MKQETKSMCLAMIIVIIINTSYWVLFSFEEWWHWFGLIGAIVVGYITGEWACYERR